MIHFAGYAVLRVTVVAMVAWLVCRFLLQHRSASTRHAVWLAAMISMGIVIPAIWILPALTLRTVYQPALEQSAFEQFAPQKITPQKTAIDRVTPIAEPIQGQAKPATPTGNGWIDDSQWTVLPSDDPVQRDAPVQHHAPVQHDAPLANDSDIIPNHPSASPIYRRFELPWILLTVYAVGAAVWVSRMLFSAIHLRRMSARARRLNASQQAAVDRYATDLSLARSPTVWISSEVCGPLVFGILRPTILLPSRFMGWSMDCQRSVLLHEMTHVARHDAVADLISQCVTACYWFHPWVHCCRHSLRREREEATDERVVAAGVGAIPYAEHLLCVLEEIQTSRNSWGEIAMSQYGDTELRVRKILRMESVMPSHPRLLCVLACTALITIGTTSVRLESAQVASTTVADPAVQPTDESKTAGPAKVNPPAANDALGLHTPPKPQPVVQKSTQSPAERPVASAPESVSLYENLASTSLATDRDPRTLITVDGVVRTSTGQPAKNAIVGIRQTNSQRYYHSTQVLALLARTIADDQGRFRFDDVPARRDDYPYQEQWEVVAATPGQYGWHSIGTSQYVKSLDLKLQETASVGGTIIDPAGQPVAGASVSVSSIDEARPDDIANLSHYSTSLFRSSLSPRTITDDAGEFVIHGLPRGYIANVVLEHPDWAPASFAIRTSDSVETGLRFPTMDPGVQNPVVFASGSTHHVDTGFSVSGFVRDSAGAPVAGCTVLVGVISTPTDREGRFQARVPSDWFDRRNGDDTIHVSVSAPIDRGLLWTRAKISKQQAADGEPLSVVMQEGIEIVGSVFSEDGEPMEGVFVEAESIETGSPDRRLTASAKADGTYRMLVPHAGTYRLWAWGKRPGFVLPWSNPRSDKVDSWAPSQTITAVDGSVAEAEPLVVRKAPAVAIRCTDKSGQPVAGATLTMLQRLPPPKDSIIRDLKICEDAITDSDGRATLFPLRLYASDVIVSASIDTGDQHLWAEVPMPAMMTSQEHTIRMKPMWKITGKATIDGAPMPGVSVMVWRQPPTHSFMGSHSMSGVPRRVDEAGTYVWFVPPVGSYSVELWSVQGLSRNNPSGRRSVTQIGTNQFRAEEMEFQMAHGTISGQVIDVDGNPVSGAHVSSIPTFTDANRLLLANPSPNTREATTDEKGDFQIDGLPDGEYNLRIRVRTNPATYYPTSAKAQVGDKDLLIKIVPIESGPVAANR
ncbi:Regulatory protein BlaR1 [Rubripirellula lacrimiformis]|uniref:Regulatory protein BlaR1 n=1 Tax=Rubripirellula lacrimiformis TaxID=1930273 RepID=A0A517NH43_9BACT|nr:carboxypeptidase regulatory-like domain-containing protein [Rubripirellula lacrimiformis]QDT06457.1 Regulatory protein BlaR1 [Rubripirellula lacrimiformis]